MFAPTASKRSRRTLWAVVLAGLALTFVLVFYFSGRSASTNSASLSTTAASYQQKAGLPARLKIPKIKVNAAIEPVGLTPDGAMDVPQGPTTTAWYSPGPHPGERGSAVITGHFGWENGAPAVFDDLHTLHTGDEVSVEGRDGSTTTFVVRGFRTYKPDEEASSVFTSSDGRAHLNLITCTGDWNKSQQSYSDRLVVFTDKRTSFEPTDFGVILPSV